MKRSMLLLQSVVMVLVFCVVQRVASDAVAETDQSAVTATANLLGTEPYKLWGLNFSPYTEPGENPNLNKPGQITLEEIMARLEAILPYTEWIRTFGCTDDLQPIGAMAHAKGLKTAIGAWLGRNDTENMRQVNTLVKLAEEGHVDIAIVGSEVLLRGDLGEEQLIQYIREVKTRFQAAGIRIPVTTADVYGEFLSHPALLPEVDLVFANYYPYWEGKSIQCAMAYLHRWHEQLKAAANGKPIVVSEAGWPSCGNRVGEAVPSPESAADFFLSFVSWAKANAVQYFYFEAYDEPWKSATEEGPQGACWGLWTSDGKLKPGMDRVFMGMTVEDCWSTCPSREPIIDFFAQPDFYITNIPTLLASGFAGRGTDVFVNGTEVPSTNIDDVGHFAIAIPLQEGDNMVELTIRSSDTNDLIRQGRKMVRYDKCNCTAYHRLAYVDVVSPDGAIPVLDGTVVIDLDAETILGVLLGSHVRGISPNGAETYMEDRTVIGTDYHRPLRVLPFSKPIPYNGFLVSPDGNRLYSQQEVLNIERNQVQPCVSILTGSSWCSAPVPGGPAITSDGLRIFCQNDVLEVNTITCERDQTPISGYFMSDIAVSPDDSLILISEYSSTIGAVDIYDVLTYEQRCTVSSLGDFAGEIAFAGNKAIIGSAGNPAWSDGRVTVVDLTTCKVLSQRSVPLADNVATSEKNEVLVSSGLSDEVQGSRLGIDVYVLSEDGNLVRTKTFFLGINRFVTSSCRPKYDQIRRIVYKPRYVPFMPKPAADINCDCVVDYVDLDTMAGQWLQAIPPATALSADLNADKKVDLKDYAILADAWLDGLLCP